MTTNDREKGLSPQQRAALIALLRGAPLAEAAEAGRCSLRTLHRWRQEPAFAAELQQGSAALIEAALRSLSALAQPAAATVGRILSDPDAPASIRLRAAQIVFDSLLKLREQVDLEARIAALEGTNDEP